MSHGNCPQARRLEQGGQDKRFASIFEVNLVTDTETAFRIQSRIRSVVRCDTWPVVKQRSYRREAIEREMGVSD